MIKIKSKHSLFDDSYDIFWIVIDREKQESKKVNLLKAIEICKENNIKISLVNPSFEFWLLLHFDISGYSKDDLFENIEHLWQHYGRQPKYHEVTKPLSAYSVGTYEKRFGTYYNNLYICIVPF